MPHVSAGSNSSGGSAPGGGGSSGGGGNGGASSSSSSRIRDDPNDCDEVKIFKCAEDEGEGDSDDVMNDDKRDLIRATECDQKGRLSPLSPLSPAFSSGGGGHSSSYSSSKNGHGTIRPDPSSIFGKSLEGVAHPSPLNMGYLMPYPYPNGSHLSSMAEKMRLGAGSLPFFCNGVEGLTQPPPAHMGYHGLSRSAMYPFGVQYPYSGLPEVSQVASWHAQSMYPISNAGSPGASAGFRNYPPTLSIPPTSIPSDFYRFSPGGLLQGPGLGGHPGLSHHLVGTPSKHDAHNSHLDHNHRSSLSDQKSGDTHGSKNASDSGQSSNSQNEKKKPHIKKPLNAFMLYMKEMRAKVVAECTLKESAAINQILGRRWHSLSREDQSKYYELARQERQLHMQLYPGWSARDNYGYGAKKKKRKKEKTSDGGREEQAKYYELARRERQLHMQMYPNWSSAQNRTHHEKKRKKKQDQKFDGGNSMKKCRARYGLDQQNQWCKPCRRKKKCIRYLEEQNNGSVASINSPDDNLGSAGSAGEPLSPDSKNGDSDMERSSDMGMSSPSFSLTSPGMSLNSPGMSLPSPAMTSPSGVLPSPASLASPAVSLPSLQSPMTPSIDDRHPNSSVSSSTSSVSYPTTTSTNQNTSTSTSTSNHHNNNNNNNSRNQSNSSPSSSSSYKQPNNNNHHHNQNNIHPQFGFGLGHLFSPGGVSPNSNGGGMGLPFPFPLGLKPHRNPVGANPHDINNPLSVNQLTGQFNSSSSSSASSLSSERSSISASSHKSLSHSNHHQNHHRPDRSRSREDHRMDTSEGVVSSKKSSGESNKGSAPHVPVIGVS